MLYRTAIAFLLLTFAAFPAWAAATSYDIALLLYEPHPWAHGDRPSRAPGAGGSDASEKPAGVAAGNAAGPEPLGPTAPGPPAREPTYILGLGVETLPDYEGSDENTVLVAPILKFRFSGQRYIALFGNKAYLNVLGRGPWEFGPMAVYRLGRKGGDIDDPVVKLMSDVDDSLELGAFLGYLKVFDGDPRHRMKITLAASQDVSGGHDGLVASLSGVYWTPVSPTFDIGFRGGVRYASDNYMQSFFGVNTADSAASGLSTFNASADIKDLSVALMAAAHLTRHWQIRGLVSYTALAGDAADSPVVAVRGDAGQLSAGVYALYSW